MAFPRTIVSLAIAIALGMACALEAAATQLNTVDSGLQRNPGVAALPNDRFALVYGDGNANDGDRAGVFGEIYSSDLTLIKSCPITTGIPGTQGFPHVAAAPNGNFFTLWRNPQNGITGAQILSSNCDRVGEPISVGTSFNGLDVTADQDGNFWVVLSINGRATLLRYNNIGEKIGVSTLLFQGETPTRTTLTTLGDGTAFVAWYNEFVSDSDILGLYINSDGTPDGEPFIVNQARDGRQSMPMVAAQRDGAVAIVWQSNPASEQDELRGVVIDNQRQIGQEFAIGAPAAGNLSIPYVTARAEGGYAVAWTEVGSPNTIYLQGFSRTGLLESARINLSSDESLGLVNSREVEIAQLSGGGVAAVWQSGTASDDIFGKVTYLRRPGADVDTDGDGIPDLEDRDDDNDGFPDHIDRFPKDPSEWADHDGDGIGDNADTDDDNDGVSDEKEVLLGINPRIADVVLAEDFELPVLNREDFPGYNGNWVDFGTPTPGFDTGPEAPTTDRFIGDSGNLWYVTQGNVDIIRGAFEAASGEQAIDLNGFEQGALSTDLVLPGPGLYEISFAFSKSPRTDQGRMAILLDGQPITGSPFVTQNPSTAEDMQYERLSGVFRVEAAGTYQLTLQSLNEGSPNGFGPTIDELLVNSIVTTPSDFVLLEDSDRDGLSDLFEAAIGTSAVDADSDDDGLDDRFEFVARSNPLNLDEDGDGVLNLFDVFPFNSAEQADNDNDGIGDNSDPDDDNDGLSDERELELGTNPLVVDSDGDSVPDAEELELGLNPLAADCPSWRCTTNRTWLWHIARQRSDSDGDGLTFAEEKQRGLDPVSADTDGDGLPDGQEIILKTNPLAADTDRDGLQDGQEVSLGTNPLAKDSDGDSVDDGEEVELGLNPLIEDCPAWLCRSGLPKWLYIIREGRQDI